MSSCKFISINVYQSDGLCKQQFINCAHIQRIFEQDDIIYIELTDYTTLEVHDEHLLNFMDRFV